MTPDIFRDIAHSAEREFRSGVDNGYKSRFKPSDIFGFLYTNSLELEELAHSVGSGLLKGVMHKGYGVEIEGNKAFVFFVFMNEGSDPENIKNISMLLGKEYAYHARGEHYAKTINYSSRPTSQDPFKKLRVNRRMPN